MPAITDPDIDFKKAWEEFGNLLEMNLETWKDEEINLNSPGPWWVLWKSWIWLKQGKYPKGYSGVFDKEFTNRLISLFKSYKKELGSIKKKFKDEDSRNVFAATLGNVYMNSIISFGISILDLILLSEPGSTKEWRESVINRLEKSKFGNEMFRDRFYDAIEWFSTNKVSKENQPIPKHVFNKLCECFKGGELCTWETLKPLFTDFKQI